jgi:hypothetical protein
MKRLLKPFAQAFTSPMQARRWRALSTLRKVVLRKLRFETGEQHVVTLSFPRPGVYKIAVLYSYGDLAGGYLFGLSGDGIRLFESPINSSHRFTQFLCVVDAPGKVHVHYDSHDRPHRIDIYAVGTELVVSSLGNRPICVERTSVCAAIASYPPRRRMLRDAVQSLLPQVDHLFVFLNNYDTVPRYLARNKEAGNIHYILDSASGLRASAKFYWVGKHECYWLICDDDIIYPPDYAATMVGAVKKYEDKAFVGVHGSIFPERLASYYDPAIVLIPFMQSLVHDKYVHMLGTGTLCLHSSVLRARDVGRLLRHPTENDETLALICRERGIPLIAIRRPAAWLQSNPKMKFGIYEENLMSQSNNKRLSALLKRGNPWPSLPLSKSEAEGPAIMSSASGSLTLRSAAETRGPGTSTPRPIFLPLTSSGIAGKRSRQRQLDEFFEYAYAHNFWGGQESRSGTGSALSQTSRIIEALPAIFEEYEINSVLDIPCGDFNWMKNVNLSQVDYTGADIVDTLIACNAKTYSRDAVRFRKLNLVTDPLPTVDLVLCRDGLVHFFYADIFRALANVVRSGSQYLMMTNFAGRKSNNDMDSVGGWRVLNFEAPPFSFPPPITMVNEGCTEDAGIFSDKSLGLWRIQDIRERIDRLRSGSTKSRRRGRGNE